jgi:hypothetical protein
MIPTMAGIMFPLGCTIVVFVLVSVVTNVETDVVTPVRRVV